MKKIRSLILFLILSVVSIITGCSGSREVTSLARNGDITIDGRQSDWDQLITIEGENIAFGFRNDADNLYLCMVTNDRNKIIKIIKGGLNVWLEPENSDDKIGILYPDKPDPSDFQFQPNQQLPEMPDQQKPGMRGEEQIDLKLYSSLSKQKELYILNDEGKVLKTYPVDGEIFKAKISFDKGNLCYEVKIPIGESLSSNSGLKTASGSKLNVEFITGEIEAGFNKMQGDMDGEGMRPSGPPAGGDFPGGGPGGGPGIGRPDRSGNRPDTTPIDYSFDVLLYK